MLPVGRETMELGRADLGEFEAILNLFKSGEGSVVDEQWMSGFGFPRQSELQENERPIEALLVLNE